MIIIDKTLSQQRIIVTVSENSAEAVITNPLAFQFATWGDYPSSTWDNSSANYTLNITSAYSINLILFHYQQILHRSQTGTMNLLLIHRYGKLVFIIIQL